VPEQRERHQVVDRVRVEHAAVIRSEAQRRRGDPGGGRPHVVQEPARIRRALQMPVVEPGGSERGRPQRPQPLVVGLVELERHARVPETLLLNPGGIGVLVVEVVVRRAVDPGHVVELELAHPVLGDQPVDHLRQVCAQLRIGHVPHPEPCVVGDLGGDVAGRRACPAGVGLVRGARWIELGGRHPQPEPEPERVQVVHEPRNPARVEREPCGVPLPVTRARALPLIVEHEHLAAQRLQDLCLRAEVGVAQPRAMLPGMECVEIDGLRARRHLVRREVLSERSGGLLRAAVVDAEVSPPEVERRARQHRALSDRSWICGVLLTVVVRRARHHRPPVERVARVVDADPRAAVRIAPHPAHRASAALPDEEPPGAVALLETGDLPLVVERPGLGLGRPEVLAPVRSAVERVYLCGRAHSRGQLRERVLAHAQDAGCPVDERRGDGLDPLARVQAPGAVELDQPAADRQAVAEHDRGAGVVGRPPGFGTDQPPAERRGSRRRVEQQRELRRARRCQLLARRHVGDA